jgi:nitroreductase
MDFRELIKKRRSIREFQDKEVPLSLLKELIQDSTLAPTSSNLQPCRFVIIQDREWMRRISDESKRVLLSELEKDPTSVVRNYEAALRMKGFNVFYNAPALILVIGPEGLYSLDVDAALTVSYLMFSATSRGLGTCWIGLGAHIQDRSMLIEIGIPPGYRVVAPVIIGYPTDIPAASPRRLPDILKVL